MVAAALLHGLGFGALSHTQPVESFSGGWRMRLNLARALIARSDLLACARSGRAAVDPAAEARRIAASA